jgi:hypothetical protein
MPIREEGGTILNRCCDFGHGADTSSFHTPSQANSSFHTPSAKIRHFTHQKCRFDISHTERQSSMVYTPFVDGLHTEFRWFAHRPLPKRAKAQTVIEHYPQRNSIFNTSI